MWATHAKAMLKCVLSRSAPRHISTTLTRLSSSESFKDQWPAKITQLEQRNPVRLKRRPILFANIKPRQHHPSHGKQEDRQKVAYIHSNDKEMGTEYPQYIHSKKSIYNRSSKHEDYHSEQRFIPKQNQFVHSHLDDDRIDRSDRKVRDKKAHNRHMSDMTDGLRGARSDRRHDRLASDELEKLNDLQLTKDDDELFGRYSKGSQDRLRELLEQDTDKRFADEQEDNFIRLSHENRGPNSMHTYESKIERFCKQGRMAEAKEYFERIVKEYRVKPTSFMYSNLIKGYAKKSDLKRCLSLYSDMKKMGLMDRDSHIYTSLFEACMRVSDKTEALEAALHVLGTIRHDSVEMSGITYKAAVKCFGLLGDLETAFRLADECKSSQKHDDYMLSALLIACNSHKTAGFQLAIGVWRALRKKKHIHLSTKQYNLLLRTLTTGGGNMQSFRQLIQHQSPEGDNSNLQVSQTLLPHTVDKSEIVTDNLLVLSPGALQADTLEAGTSHKSGDPVTKEKFSEQTELVSISEELVKSDAADLMPFQEEPCSFLPDILNSKHKLPANIVLQSLDEPHDRLTLLGGVPGVLSRMKGHGCDPDVITFFYMLRALPNSKKYEDGLLQAMQENSVTPDGKFYQYLFLRAAQRRCPNELWQHYLSSCEMDVTHTKEAYSILADVCTTLHKCRQLLTHMKEAKFVPTLAMFKSMLRLAGCTHFDHLKLILEEINRCSLRPDGELCDILAKKLETGKSKLVTQEINENEKPRLAIDGEAMRSYSIFYKDWLQASGVA
ncbi:pentatricopeptide repeat-containing protein 1, mitochondrial-like [Watersipora subatra]|uniref:pentatricopeptide repeat-containing protein 1, mitochondrial-like n=1 Tax=Watersipora subatra TaxID=2589382 RepID=UPI00355C7EF8